MEANAMYITQAKINLDIPEELNTARLWWVLSFLPSQDIDFVLQFAEEVAQSRGVDVEVDVGDDEESDTLLEQMA